MSGSSSEVIGVLTFFLTCALRSAAAQEAGPTKPGEHMDQYTWVLVISHGSVHLIFSLPRTLC